MSDVHKITDCFVTSRTCAHGTFLGAEICPLCESQTVDVADLNVDTVFQLQAARIARDSALARVAELEAAIQAALGSLYQYEGFHTWQIEYGVYEHLRAALAAKEE